MKQYVTETDKSKDAGENNEDLTGNKNEDSIKELKLKISMRLKLKKT